MDVVGIDQLEWRDDHVHTIDVWYSKRRERWVVERLNSQGFLVGTTYCSGSLDEAEACVSHWLRSHDEAHLVAKWIRADQMSADESWPEKKRASDASDFAARPKSTKRRHAA